MRILIVAAHPDDETIGASTILGGMREVAVLHVTDGVPRDQRWWPDPAISAEVYAARRRRELDQALALANVSPARVFELGFADQEASRALPELVDRLTEELARLAPDLVVTHAYEGGHPDHDAIAFAISLARERLTPAPRVFEMALYHGATGVLTTGGFPGGPAGCRRLLAEAQQRRRRAMLECFTSQRATLAPFFGVAHECFRAAPGYDFTRPPHPGPLHYERLGFPITSAEWRVLAARVEAHHRESLRVPRRDRTQSRA